jgi:hypothetical protein
LRIFPSGYDKKALLDVCLSEVEQIEKLSYDTISMIYHTKDGFDELKITFPEDTVKEWFSSLKSFNLKAKALFSENLAQVIDVEDEDLETEITDSKRGKLTKKNDTNESDITTIDDEDDFEESKFNF